MKKRLLAWILVIAMGISCVPIQVFAQEVSEEPESVLMDATVETTEVTEEPTEATVEPTEATEEPTEATEEITEATEELLLPEETDAAEALLFEETFEVEEPVLEVASDGEVVTSGSCGASMYYSLDSDGVMTISGEGDMSAFITYPWENWRGSITELVVEEGVTSIADYAFSSCYYLTSVSFPSTLESIGDEAFAYGWNLYNLVIPASVSSIGTKAFAWRRSLQHISFEHQYNQYLLIGSNAFKAEDADATNKKFTTVDVPDAGNVNYYIRNYNWAGDFRKLVGDSYYSRPVDNTITASDITLVVNRTQAQTADINASAKGGAILSYSSDTSSVMVSSSGTLTIAAGYSGTAKITITAAKTAGYKETTRTISVKVASAGTVIDSGYCGDNVTYTLTAEGLLTITGSGAMTNYSSSGGVTTAPWSSNVKRVTKVAVKGSVDHIGSSAFIGCSNLTSLSLPDSVTRIGNYAFEKCTSLASLSLPDSVTEIGSYAFHGCTGLTSVSLPNASIGEQAFCVCTGLTSVTMAPNSADDATRVIGPYAFSGCTKLSELTLPDNISEIKSSAFRSCTALTHVTLPKGLTKLGSQAFINTPITEIVIPASLTTCGITGDNEGPFAGCLKLERATLTDGIRTIPDNLFAGVSYLEYVSVPDTVVTVGANAFYGCSILQSIYFPATTRQIGLAFYPYSPEKVYYGGTQTKWSAVTVDELNGLPTPQCSHVHDFSHETNTVAGATIYTCDCGGYRNEKQLPLPTEKNTINASDITLTADSTKTQTVSLNASALGDAALSYSSDNASVTVSTAGVVTIPKGFSGTAQITITAAATTEYLETTKVITVTVNPAPSIQADAEIVVGSVKALAGKDITVPVTITKNPGIAGFSLTVSYDAEALTLNSVSVGDLIQGLGLFDPDEETGIITWYTLDNVPDTGVLMNLNFTVNEDAAEGNTAVLVGLLDEDESSLSNEDGYAVSVNFTAGQIEVTRGVLGDVSGDGKVAINDIVLLNRSLHGKYTLSETAKKLGDVTGDGKIAINDVVKLNRFIHKRISSLSASAVNVQESANKVASAVNVQEGADKVASSASIGVGTITAMAGQTVTIPVTITNNPGIAGFALLVSYNSEILTLNSVSDGNLIQGVGLFDPDEESGIITWYALDNITDDGELMKLSFTVQETAPSGSTAVSVSLLDNEEVSLTDEDGAAVAVEFTPGAVVVPSPNTIEAEDITVTGSNEQDITVPLNASALGGAALSYSSGNPSIKISADGVVTIPKGFSGTVKITITAAATGDYLETTKDITLTVKPAPVPNTINASDIDLTGDDTKDQTISITATAQGDAKLSYTSDNEAITVSETGVVTIPAGFLGTAKITITAAAVEGYLETTKEITISVTMHNTIYAEDITVTGSILDAITVPLNATALDGAKLTYRSSTTSVTISEDGVATIAKGYSGTVQITITAEATEKYLETTKIITLTVKPGPIYNTITAPDITLTVNEEEAQTVSLNAAALGGAALTYRSESEDVTVTQEGEVTVAAGFLGTASITITAAAVEGYLETTKTVTVTVNPLVTDPDVKLMVGSETVYGNDSITIPVYLTRNRGISRLTLNVRYDPAVLTLDGISAGQAIGNLGTFTDAGDGSASWAYTKDITTIGQLALLHFSVSEDAAAEELEARISVSLSGLTNKAGQEKTFTSTPGQVKVYYYQKLYTITYDANGGENAPEAQQKSMLLISDQTPTRKYYKFLGWAESPDAEEAQYEARENYGELDRDITLYAVWEPIESAIVVEKPKISLTSGQSVKLNAYAYPDENAKILFKLDNPEDSKYVTLKGNVLTAKNVKDITWLYITATTDNNSAPPVDISVKIHPKVTRVDISEWGVDGVLNNKTLTVNTNEKYIDLWAVTYPEDAWYEVTWKSSNPSIAEVDDGYVTLHKAGKVTITATAADGSKKSAKVTLNIVQPTASLEILNAPQTLQGGQKFTLKTDIGQNVKGIDRNVTWALDEASAAFASIKNGALTTKVVYEPVTIHVTAYATANREAIDEADITLLPAATAARILYEDDITEKTMVLPLKVGETLDLEGGSYPETAYGTGIWKSSSTKIATVDANGTVTGIATGAATITYTFAGKSTSVKIQVGTPVTKISLYNEYVDSGKSITLSADVNYDASVRKVIWSLANPADSAYCTLTSSGKFTAKTVYRKTYVDVIATAADGSGVTGKTTVKISPKSDNFLTVLDADSKPLNNSIITLEPSESMQVSANFWFSSDSNRLDIIWKSSNPSVASVDSTGKITAKKAGTAKITASLDWNKSVGSFTVKVGTRVNKIQVGVKNNLTPVLMSGKSLNMTAQTNPDASNKKVTWSLEYPNKDTKCASISSSGVLKAAAGLTYQTEVNVIATAADGSGTRSEAFNVKIYPAATGVNIQRGSRVVNGLTIVTSEKESVLAAKVFPYAAQQGVTWKSSSTKIATVDADGKVTFLKPGTVTITATAADGSKKAASFKLTYKPA